MGSRIVVTEMAKGDLPFLFDLWHMREVMRYADEFPRLRGWSKSDDIESAWEQYQMKRCELDKEYTQLILRLDDDTPIGESFFAPLEEGFTFGKWQKPEGIISVMGDLKLLPQYWGQGLGTEGMRQVVRFVFTVTNCELFAVPPHRNNPAAYRVYEKAGFVLFTGMRSWRNHKIMEISKEMYRERYGD
ncbi:MAG: GNAT family N-acetyltransferase [Anaerolineaceae bacterium]|nr:MAG: GNAT family N-acetyltransferase [Anaerolineaceae bacterium]